MCYKLLCGSKSVLKLHSILLLYVDEDTQSLTSNLPILALSSHRFLVGKQNTLGENAASILFCFVFVFFFNKKMGFVPDEILEYEL